MLVTKSCKYVNTQKSGIVKMNTTDANKFIGARNILIVCGKLIKGAVDSYRLIRNKYSD